MLLIFVQFGPFGEFVDLSVDERADISLLCALLGEGLESTFFLTYDGSEDLYP